MVVGVPLLQAARVNMAAAVYTERIVIGDTDDYAVYAFPVSRRRGDILHYRVYARNDFWTGLYPSPISQAATGSLSSGSPCVRRSSSSEARSVDSFIDTRA